MEWNATKTFEKKNELFAKPRVQPYSLQKSQLLKTPLSKQLTGFFRRMDFDDAESENDRVCFETNNIYFTQSDLVTSAEIKNWTWNKTMFRSQTTQVSLHRTKWSQRKHQLESREGK